MGWFWKKEKKKNCGDGYHSENYSVRKSMSFEIIPTKGGGHTSFLLCQCDDCGKLVPFPDSNFSLVKKEVKRQIMEVLKKKGYEIAPGF